jgi:hypothetical protein
MCRQDPGQAARLAAYGRVSSRLFLLSDRQLGAAVAAARPTGSGIGGTTAELDVGGTPVFVKRVPVTGIEMSPRGTRGRRRTSLGCRCSTSTDSARPGSAPGAS